MDVDRSYPRCTLKAWVSERSERGKKEDGTNEANHKILHVIRVERVNEAGPCSIFVFFFFSFAISSTN